ncbi:hypothetical protein ACPV5L_19280 [Vibrio astriarenae]
MHLNIFGSLLLTAVVLTSPLALADLFEELSQLKKICDAGLLTKEQCESRQEKILHKHDESEEGWFCNYAGQSTKPTQFSGTDDLNFSESASVSSIVKEILDEAGLSPNFIVRPANVPNAAASARSGHRFIEYNPSFVSQLKVGAKTNWSVYSVMAHEIGHHLQGHTLRKGGSRPDIELEADEYSGFILAKLGATLAEAQKAMSTFGSDSSRGTHPKTADRLAAIKRGWEKANKANTKAPTLQTSNVSTSSDQNGAIASKNSNEQKKSPIQEIATPPMPTLVYTDSCVINGEPIVITSNGTVLSKVRGYMQVGLKANSSHPNCYFNILSQIGSYCVTSSGSVHFGTPVPVGYCQPCNGNICN